MYKKLVAFHYMLNAIACLSRCEATAAGGSNQDLLLLHYMSNMLDSRGVSADVITVALAFTMHVLYCFLLHITFSPYIMGFYKDTVYILSKQADLFIGYSADWQPTLSLFSI